MRVTSELWISAMLRRAFASGGFAAVERAGAREAGAILVVARHRDGTFDLYGPAPQTGYEEARPAERLFQLVLERAEEAAVRDRLERETRFDSDVWIVELETGTQVTAELVPLVRP